MAQDGFWSLKFIDWNANWCGKSKASDCYADGHKHLPITNVWLFCSRDHVFLPLLEPARKLFHLRTAFLRGEDSLERGMGSSEVLATRTCLLPGLAAAPLLCTGSLLTAPRWLGTCGWHRATQFPASPPLWPPGLQPSLPVWGAEGAVALHWLSPALPSPPGTSFGGQGRRNSGLPLFWCRGKGTRLET